MVQKTQKKADEVIDEIQHVLVPKHELVSDAEKTKLLENYKVSTAELPKIRAKDPAIKHLKVQQGDIIKISRKSISAGQSVFYRAVTME